MTPQRLTLLYRDDDVVVVNKPAGVLSVDSPNATGKTVAEILRHEGIRALPVHRLDRDVSGAMVLGLHEEARAALEMAFRERRVTKIYLAFVQGKRLPEQGSWNWPIEDRGADAAVSPRGKPALTRFKVTARYGVASEVEVDLLTGRYNQIRLHFAHAGFPLVGERKYAFGRDALVRFKRVALHAMRLSLPHPVTKETLTFEAPLPADLQELRSKLSKPTPNA